MLASTLISTSSLSFINKPGRNGKACGDGFEYPKQY